MDGKMDRQMEVWMDDGQMEVRMDRWKYGWTDEWMDGQMKV